jgi:CRP-like cAMP-binding protein
MTVNPAHVREKLRNSTLLGALPDSVLFHLVNHVHNRRFAKGETVVTRGDPGDSLMIVDNGCLKVFNVTADGREVVLNFLRKGDLLGEIAVLDGLPRTANVIALEPTEVVALHRRDVVPVLMANGEALMDVVRVLCEKLRASSAVIEENMLPMTARTAAGLLRLAEQHGVKTKDGVRIDLKLSQRDLGNYLELSRENANRQLGLLRDAGFIRLDSAHIVILNEDALRSYAEAGLD